MVPVKLRWDLMQSLIIPAAIVLVCPVLVWLVLSHLGLGKPMYAVIGILAVIVAVYIGLWHPLWLYWAFAFVLAGLPFGTIPGVHVPLYILLAAAIVLAAIIYPRTEPRLCRLEIAILVMVGVAGVSVVVTSLSFGGLYQYTKWSIVTLVAVALIRLSQEDLRRFGRIYVVVSAVNALWGLLLVTVDKTAKSLSILRPFGYDINRVEEGVRAGQQYLVNYAISPDGSKSIRLGGTWVAGNGAGFAFLLAIALCLLFFRGWPRNCMVIVLSVAVILTQSRQNIFTLLVGLLLVVIFHTSIRARDRWYAAGALAAMAIVALSVPYIRYRLLNSLSSSDPGGAARRASLSDFPNVVSGHWLFGLGWSRPEFKSGAESWKLNIISNAPLLHVYRAGILTSLAFIAVCVIGCLIAYRALRSDSLPFAVYGAIFIAYCFVSLQLDHGAVDVPQATLGLSVLLAFLIYIDRSLHMQALVPGKQELAVVPHSQDAHGRLVSVGSPSAESPRAIHS